MVATANGHTTTEYTGKVAKLNERGLLFAGEASWRNISKFSGAIELPNVGDTVSVKLDGSGFIREIRPVNTVQVSETTSASELAQNRATARETAITRMNVLAHATAFTVACGGTVDDLLAVAEQLEQWVLR
ncbi:MAG TPA: hypothetical protein VFD32_12650 [Dehalococcoidia bacterium]|nr:hypothetical protein [Dehalococcoidia bacterium]